MNNNPFISICIPSYNRVIYLERLLISIGGQTFKDFEVIITDDSPDDSVFLLQQKYIQFFRIQYKKNPSPLGTPENWNEAIRMAQGEWIKIMHDDDWFAFPNALAKYVELIKANPKASFLFSGSQFIRNGKVFGGMHISKWELKLLTKDPCNLYYKNFIGPPSVVIHKNEKDIWYDKDMKWLVDIDFYIRYLRLYPQFAYTTEALVNVGYSASQVTEQVFHDKTVFVKENLMLLQKHSHNILKRIWNYDYTWRMMRNYHISNERELKELYPPGADKVPLYHKYILHDQKYIPHSALEIGILSKFLMTISFVISRLRK